MSWAVTLSHKERHSIAARASHQEDDHRDHQDRQDLPKQVVLYMLPRHHTITGNRDGLREAALLGKLGASRPSGSSKGVTCSAYYFTNFERLYRAHDALDAILQ